MRRRLKGAARPILFQLAASFWALLFVLLGKTLRPNPARLQIMGGERALIIAPHPDDETLGCGGTLARHVGGGDQVCILIVTDGGNSRAGGLSREEMVERRKREVADAMFMLAPTAQVKHLALPEGSWSAQSLIEPLSNIIAKFQPHLIYAPSCVDYHPEHKRVAAALAATLGAVQQERLRTVRVYEVQAPLTPVLVNLVSDINEYINHKMVSLSAYRTQAESLGAKPGMLGWPSRQAIYLRLLYRAKGYIEVFWEMTPGQYSAVMKQCRESARFRGLRHRPFSDGSAWVAGWRARARLKRIEQNANR